GFLKDCVSEIAESGREQPEIDRRSRLFVCVGRFGELSDQYRRDVKAGGAGEFGRFRSRRSCCERMISPLYQSKSKERVYALSSQASAGCGCGAGGCWRGGGSGSEECAGTCHTAGVHDAGCGAGVGGDAWDDLELDAVGFAADSGGAECVSGGAGGGAGD